jgi:transposase
MMRPVGEVKVYLHREPIDMRKGRNGLAALVREGMRQDPFASEALYVFVGRRYDALRIATAFACGGRRSRARRSFAGRGCWKRTWSH